MQKAFIIFLFFFFLIGCVSTRKVLDTWMGSTSQSLIATWGPPDRTADDGNGGQILIYAHQVYVPNINVNYWEYKMMYADKDGKIYHWLLKRMSIPPTQIDVRFLN